MKRSLKSSKHRLWEFADLQSVRKVFGIWTLAACLIALSMAMSGSAWAVIKNIEFRPDGTTGKDATVHSIHPDNTGWNTGSDKCLRAEAWTWNGTPGSLRSFIQFDLTPVPSDATVISAKLFLYADTCEGISTVTASNAAVLRQVTSSWDENTISWNNQPSTTTQNQVLLPEISNPIHPNDSKLHRDYPDIDVTNLVRSMVANPSSNFGFMFGLQQEKYYSLMSFSSSDATDPNLRPKLVVTYEEKISNSVCGGVTNGLVACYPFDGNANDESGNGNHGSVKGGAVLTSDRFGIPDKAYRMDGINGYIEAPDSPSLNIGTGDYSMSIWVRYEGNGSVDFWGIEGVLIDKREPVNAKGYSLYFYPEKIGTQIADNGKYHFGNFNGTSVLEDGQWHHVVATVERKSTTGLKFYIDGTVIITLNPTAFIGSLDNLGTFKIGHSYAYQPYPAHGFLKGSVDDVRLYNRTLTEAEVKQLYTPSDIVKPAICPTTPTIRSKASGNWTDAAIWDSGRIPNASDVVQIESGHTVTAEFSKVTGLCNFGTINSQNSDLRIDASDFLYNKGTIRASDAKNSECPVKNNPSVYKHPSQLSSGNSIFLWADKFTNEGQITGGKGGDDSTWLCLSDSDPGKWSYPVISTDGTIRLHKSEKGTWQLQQGETQYGFPSIGGVGGKVEIRSTGFENSGTIKGGKGGYGDSSSNGYGVHGVSIGGKGGEVIVTPADLEKSSNKGTLQGGCGGEADIAGCWSTGDIYCNSNNVNPSRPGNGGDVTFNAVDMSGIIKGCAGSISRWDPTTLKATATTRFEGSDYVEIYGREGWVMDLTSLIEGAVTANKTITIAIGKGGTIDLRGVKGKVFQAAEKVEFFADTVLLDSGVTVQDLAQAANVTVAPGKILYRVALSSVQQVVGKAGETVPIQLSVFNNGSTADTYTLTVESSTGWKVIGLPGTVTVEGLKSVQIPLNITLSSAQGDNGVITITAASQNDPQVRTIAVIRTATEDGPDSDGDGIPDEKDIFPNDPKEQLDSDKDGIGDNTDTDDDNDGMPDEWEKRYNLNPLVSDASQDADKDGFTNLDEYKAGTDPNDPASKPATYSSGIFTVDSTGIVKTDWLYDGGKYQGEFGIFNLAGMENLAPGSPEFITEAVKRVLSNSEQGYLVFSDLQEGARFSGILGGEIKDWNAGAYKGVKSLTMKPGTQFATMLVPNSAFASLAQNPSTTDTNRRPLFSLVSSNPVYGMYIGQMADVNGMGKAYSYEDKDAATSDKDFNDLIVMITGATADLPSIDDLKSQVVTRAKRDGTDWRTSELGRLILEHVESPAAAEDTLSMTVSLNAADTLLVYDPAGKVIGKDGGWISGATFELKADGTQTVTLPDPAGNYRVSVQGAATAQGLLTVTTYQGSAEISSDQISLDIAPHQILTTTIAASDTEPPIVAPVNAAPSYDFNGDGVTDNTDVSMLVKHWNSCKGQQKYDAFFDVNDDGCITVADIMTVLNAKTVK